MSIGKYSFLRKSMAMQGTLIIHIANLSIWHMKCVCPNCLLATCQQCHQIWWCSPEPVITHPSSIFQFGSKSTALQGTFIIHIANLSIWHMKCMCLSCLLAICQWSGERPILGLIGNLPTLIFLYLPEQAVKPGLKWVPLKGLDYNQAYIRLQQVGRLPM